MSDLREALITFVADRFWRERWQAAEHVDAMMKGPLADLIAAREERDEARALTRDLHRRTQKAERFRDRWKSWSWMFNKRCTEQRRRMKAENNIIALAKLYGEACSELQVLRYLLHATADEAAIADFMMSNDAAQCGFATPIPATEEAGDV